jgi:hypothetical protein
MTWVVRSHTCSPPLPPPDRIGVGSVWRDDEGTDSCGRYWQLQTDEAGEFVYVETSAPN